MFSSTEPNLDRIKSHRNRKVAEFGVTLGDI